MRQTWTGQAWRAEIARLVPDRVLTPIALRADRGWFLSPDGGPTVRDLGSDGGVFPQILKEYAALQRSLIDHGGSLSNTGLEVIHAGQMADHLEHQVQELATLPTSHPLHADAALVNLATKAQSVIMDAANNLAQITIPNTLQHNDLHHGNTFAPASGPLRFFDFGDGVWSHPFCSLYVTAHKLAQDWRCAVDDPRIGHVIDSYLEEWTDFAPLMILRDLVPSALVIGKWQRFNSWHRLLPHFPSDELSGRAGYLQSMVQSTIA